MHLVVLSKLASYHTPIVIVMCTFEGLVMSIMRDDLTLVCFTFLQ